MKYIKYFPLIAILAVLIVSCEKDDSSIIDPVLTFPKVLSASVSPILFDTSVVNAVAIAEVTSEEPVAKVTVEVKNPLDIGIVFELKDDGVSPDANAGDGFYTGTIHISMTTCRLVGEYGCNFIALNVSGLYSNNIVQTFNVINSQSKKPVLSNLVAPDSLQRPSGIGADTVRYSSLHVRATDPDGQCDLKVKGGVIFNSFKPNGEPSLDNPFPMYDDGDEQGHCDAVANDGIFSSCIRIVNNPFKPPPPQLGNYTFKFNAIDRSFVVSDTLSHIIYVYP